MANNEPKFVCPPNDENIKKPFFAYGIFKPGQIAFPKIEKYVWKCEPNEIPRKMLIRDGVPIIDNKESLLQITKGYKIYFNNEECESAYMEISKTEPYQLYEWDVIDINGEECNILIGKDSKLGSHQYLDDYGKYVDCFDGKKDPYFDNLVEFIRDELKNEKFPRETRFYKLQMYYMLLWSTIDRYCSLKYGAYNDQWELRSRLADDKVFIESLNECLDKRDLGRDRVVFSTNLKKFYLSSKNPWFAINYYYAIRCNVVHRGKLRMSEEAIIETALYELLDIFESVLDKTFIQ